MFNKIIIWIQARYRNIINSIAFYPAFIALLFLAASIGMISFDFSETGKAFKSQMHWLSLKDASTARSIISAIAAGIISLTVFSFSMVMIVLNQAASQMSNRILDNLIGNRLQQAILGIYIGTIVYALFLLSTIRDIDSGLYIPALSTYILILITIIDIFLFIYFLHYITQSVKYEVIIRRIYRETKTALETHCCLKEQKTLPASLATGHYLASKESGIFESFNKNALVKVCEEQDLIIELLIIPGSYVIKGTPLLELSKLIDEELEDKILSAIYFPVTESIEDNYSYGIRQLMEIAIKALSPGINDPGTAVVSLRSLIDLFSDRSKVFPDRTIVDKNKQVRIITLEKNFDRLFAETIFPIWDYGKDDRMVQLELMALLEQLRRDTKSKPVEHLWDLVNRKIQQHISEEGK